MSKITTDQLLQKKELTKDDLIYLLGVTGNEKLRLFEHAASVREQFTGNKVYFRGLIEFSNICGKNCNYCGIRKDNQFFKRYSLTDDEII